MNASDPAISDIWQSVKAAVRLHWALFVAQGVIMTILGVLAVIWPQLAPTVFAFLWSLLTAALSLLVGISLLWHPVEGAVPLTLVLIAFFVVEGIFQIAASFSYREIFHGSWGWMLASGIADLILAALIIAGWPGTAGWALGLIVGVNLITSGVAIMMVAFSARSTVRMVEKALQ